MQPSNVFYFAYGSNMNPERIRVRIPHARLVGKATIKGWRLVERLYADIEEAKDQLVDGVLYLVTQSEVFTLDRYEGYPSVYSCAAVDAYLDVRHKVRAMTYVMTPATRKERTGRPYPEDYRLVCSAGAQAHGVPDAFARAGDAAFFAKRTPTAKRKA